MNVNDLTNAFVTSHIKISTANVKPSTPFGVNKLPNRYVAVKMNYNDDLPSDCNFDQLSMNEPVNAQALREAQISA